MALARIPDQLPAAIAHYEEALRIKPTYAEAQNNLAVALVKTPGRAPDAIAHYEEALRLNPDRVETRKQPRHCTGAGARSHTRRFGALRRGITPPPRCRPGPLRLCRYPRENA